MDPAAIAIVDERTARQVLLLQAYESGDDTPAAWSDEDRAWATRAARETTPATAPPPAFVVERARHAMQRLRTRDAQLGRWLEPSATRRLGGLTARAWLGLAAALAFGAGLLADRIGPAQRIDLFAPAVWLLVGWNVAVFGWSAVAALRRRGARAHAVRRALAALLEPALPHAAPLRRFAASWHALALPLHLARAALVLHLAAAALGAGIVAGMYLRGLVLDYRAGWQSTFLEADTVRGVLGVLLAPASALTGIALPDAPALAAQRVLPGAAAHAGAAPWLHLYAATLLIFVVAPRLLLTAHAAWRARRLSCRFALPLDEPYFRRLLRQGARGPLVACIVPHAAPAAPAAALGLQSLLADEGEAPQLRFVAAVPYGEEDDAGSAGIGGCTLCIALFDAAATPEPEVHGRMLAALAARGVPLVAVVDEASFVRRFGAASPRRAERRAAWQQLAQTHGVGLVAAALDEPDGAARERMRRLLDGHAR